MKDETISTTELCRRLGIQVSTRLLLELGCKPFAVSGQSYWWDEDDYLDICEALGKYLMNGGAELNK